MIHALFAWQKPYDRFAPPATLRVGRKHTETTRHTARQSRDLLVISDRVAWQHYQGVDYSTPFLRDQVGGDGGGWEKFPCFGQNVQLWAQRPAMPSRVAAVASDMGLRTIAY